VDRNDRNILILGVLALILLAVAYYFLLFSPLRQEYLARYDERTQKEAREQQLEQTVADLENVQRNAPDIERQILEYGKRIPEQDEIPTLVVQIQEVADEANVTQLSIRPSPPEAPPGGGDFSRIPITMSFEGTYEEMQDFLLRVRNLARLVTINDVTYCRPPPRGPEANCPIQGTGQTGGETTASGGGGNKLTVEVAAETYVQPAAGESTTSSGGSTTPAGGATTPAGGGTTSAGGGKAGGAKADKS
jgi:type IV pilus assembly protein PilO